MEADSTCIMHKIFLGSSNFDCFTSVYLEQVAVLIQYIDLYRAIYSTNIYDKNSSGKPASVVT